MAGVHGSICTQPSRRSAIATCAADNANICRTPWTRAATPTRACSRRIRRSACPNAARLSIGWAITSTSRTLPSAAYLDSLAEERRVLIEKYRLRDLAFKAVGVGSVGTFCAIGLFATLDGDVLLLQLKQAERSVLAAHAGESAYENQGQRVVVGQRMMQAAPDVFLGWTKDMHGGRHFYVRQLKDSRLASVGAEIQGAALPFYARLCGRTLARAHARSGDSAMIAGYLGDGSSFDDAIAAFAIAYADQTVADHATFLAAIHNGRIAAVEEHA